MKNLKGSYTATEIAFLLEAMYKDAGEMAEMLESELERKLRNLLDEDFNLETIRIINGSKTFTAKLLDKSVLCYNYNTNKITLFLP